MDWRRARPEGDSKHGAGRCESQRNETQNSNPLHSQRESGSAGPPANPEPPCDPATLLLGLHPEEVQAGSPTFACTRSRTLCSQQPRGEHASARRQANGGAAPGRRLPGHRRGGALTPAAPQAGLEGMMPRATRPGGHRPRDPIS